MNVAGAKPPPDNPAHAAAESSSDGRFDTADLTTGPTATIRLPYHVPAGFHRNRVADEA